MARARAAILRTAAPPAPTCSRASRWRCSAQLPWRGVPYIPVEIMLLPRWFPFHLDKVAYWSRTVMVPLFILCTRKPVAKNPAQRAHPRAVHDAAGKGARLFSRRRADKAACSARAFSAGRPAWPNDRSVDSARMRARATRRRSLDARAAQRRGRARRDFPAMVNALEAMTILGYANDDPRRVTAKRALQKLLVVGPIERLLPALRLAGLGHGIRRARHAGGRRCSRSARRDARARLAANASNCSTSRAIGRSIARD